jgi:glycosyltransferase involved in cell wall biosynthesis
VMKRLKICYLLESSDMSGGVRVVFDQVRAMRLLGHEVRVRARFGDHTWYPYQMDVDYRSDLSEPPIGMELDVAIGTFWTTVEPAMRLPARLAVHLCQGCEFDCGEFLAFKEDIEAVYRHPVPKLTVGEWLCDRIRSRFGNDRFPVASIGQIVDTDMYRPDGGMPPLKKNRSSGGAHILVVGMYECGFKGVSIALDAVEKARREGFHLHLTRVSPLPLSSEERTHTVIDAYHEWISPLKVAEVYRSADIFLAPSTEAEGFGLPFAEALASGLPTVASRIPSFLSLGPPHDYAYFVPVGDAAAMAEGLRRLLVDADLRGQLGRQGVRVIRGRFNAAAVAKKLETSLQEMIARQGW